jgi:hypothetical protein
MKAVLVKFVMASVVLLSACAPQQTISSSANQSLPPSPTQSDKPKNGFVPDEKTAISIAVAVWVPMYGAKQIESEKPYNATLKDGVWNVTSTLPRGKYVAMSEADISQDNGCILRVNHPAFTF